MHHRRGCRCLTSLDVQRTRLSTLLMTYIPLFTFWFLGFLATLAVLRRLKRSLDKPGDYVDIQVRGCSRARSGMSYSPFLPCRCADAFAGVRHHLHDIRPVWMRCARHHLSVRRRAAIVCVDLVLRHCCISAGASVRGAVPSACSRSVPTLAGHCFVCRVLLPVLFPQAAGRSAVLSACCHQVPSCCADDGDDDVARAVWAHRDAAGHSRVLAKISCCCPECDTGVASGAVCRFPCIGRLLQTRVLLLFLVIVVVLVLVDVSSSSSSSPSSSSTSWCCSCCRVQTDRRSHSATTRMASPAPFGAATGSDATGAAGAAAGAAAASGRPAYRTRSDSVDSMASGVPGAPHEELVFEVAWEVVNKGAHATFALCERPLQHVHVCPCVCVHVCA
jgi:hypothetical protein